MAASMKKRLLWICPILLAEIVLLAYVSWMWGARNLNSDLSADMILPEFLSRTGGIMSRNWYYSTELRVLHTQLILKPLFWLFNDWRLIRACGIVIAMLFLEGSFLFLCSTVSFGKDLLLISPLILWPFSMTYHRFVLFGLCYVPYLFIQFLSLGLVLDQKRSREPVRLAAILFLSFAAGLGGFRMPAICYVPLFIAAFLSSGFSFSDLRSRKAEPEFFRSFLALAGSLAGCLVNFFFLSKVYRFQTHGGTRLTAPQWGRLFRALKDSLIIMGARKPDRLSFSSFSSVCMLLMFLLFFFFFVRLLLNWRMLSREERALLIFFPACYLITVATPFITTEYWGDRYLIMPCIGLFMIPVFYFRHFPISPGFCRTVCIYIAVSELFAGCVQLHTFAYEDRYAEQEGVIRYILDSGLEFGFGDWDCSDAITELSDGRIRFCKLISFKEPQAWYWLMEADFRKYAENRPVFLLYGNHQLSFHGNVGHLVGDWEKEDLKYLDAGRIVYSDDYYTVWQYDSLESLEEAAGKKF